jgi:acetate kinase
VRDRARIVDGLSFLGLAIGEPNDSEGLLDRRISAEGSSVETLVVRAREDLEIARQVRELLWR